MTSTETSQQLVDMEILVVVHEAAKARLAKVRSQEYATYGVAKTDLTDVARETLANWTAPPTAEGVKRRPPIVQIEEVEQEPVEAGGPPEVTYRARCSVCDQTWDGATRSEARSASRGHARDEHMTPFRFLMTRDTYETIKSRIHEAGLSVAQVVQDGLEAFARTGKA